MALSTLVEETECSGACFFLQIRIPSVPGAGGYAGGVGGTNNSQYFPHPVTGQGQVPHVVISRGHMAAHSPGNQFLVPLVGGSGGRGRTNGLPDNGCGFCLGNAVALGWGSSPGQFHFDYG